MYISKTHFDFINMGPKRLTFIVIAIWISLLLAFCKCWWPWWHYNNNDDDYDAIHMPINQWHRSISKSGASVFWLYHINFCVLSPYLNGLKTLSFFGGLGCSLSSLDFDGPTNSQLKRKQDATKTHTWANFFIWEGGEKWVRRPWRPLLDSGSM